jgi:hypothetical protein
MMSAAHCAAGRPARRDEAAFAAGTAPAATRLSREEITIAEPGARAVPVERLGCLGWSWERCFGRQLMTVDPEPGSVPGPVGEDAPAGPPPVSGPEGAAGPSAMLAATADRERAIDVLKAGFAEGRLTRDEHDDRVARVYAARTYGELAPLVADLPAGALASVPYYLAAGCPPARAAVPPVINSLAVASLICGLAEVPTLGLSALPAVMLGARARQEIRETGQRGEALAVTGLILGWTGLVLFFTAVLGIMIWLVLPPAPGTGGPIGG